MDRPQRKMEEIQCLTAHVTINGVKAYALFDSGSTTDAMSPEFAKVAKMPLYTLERPMTLKLGCVGSKSKINFGMKAKAHFAGQSTEEYFDIANIDQYDIILGIPYMHKNGIVLDIPAQEIVVRGTLHMPPILRGEERLEEKKIFKQNGRTKRPK